ncbi:unnamed protein product [Choristocarpus tenellus]
MHPPSTRSLLARVCCLHWMSRTITSCNAFIHSPLVFHGIPGAKMCSSTTFGMDPRKFGVDDKSSLEDYVSRGPLGSSVGSPIDVNAWRVAAGELASSLGINPTLIHEAQRRRIFHLYLPLFFWIQELLEKRKHVLDAENDIKNHGPLVVGISAPQGCGKSTLVEQLRRLLERRGQSCEVLSIDDFYLTGEQQDDLAGKNPENNLLQVRGNAGTHDLELALATVKALRELRPGDAPLSIPQYDKSARRGRGDRAPKEAWATVVDPPQVILLEGWMLGFEALPEGASFPIAGVERDETSNACENGSLNQVNIFLHEYEKLHDEVDAWVVLKTSNPEMVFEWRAEAERKMRAEGKAGLTDEEVQNFCSLYMPAYRAYLPGLYEKGERGAWRRGGSGSGSWKGGLGRDDVEDFVARGICLESSEGDELGLEVPVLMVEVGRDRNPV